MLLVLPPLVPAHHLRKLGAGADQAHVARDDVPQLGKLVEAHPSQEPAERRVAGIVVPLVADPPVGPHERDLSLAAVRLHRAELVDGERTPEPADPRLAVQHARAEEEPNRGRHHHRNRKEHQEQRHATNEVDDGFEDTSVGAGRVSQYLLLRTRPLFGMAVTHHRPGPRNRLVQFH